MDNPFGESRVSGLSALKEANHPAFSDARREYQDLVFSFVSRRIQPAEDAEDVTAEVFLDAYRHWARCKGPARLWLLGIARRKVADAYRKRRSTVSLANADRIASGNEPVESSAAGRAYAVLLSLPADERDALSLQILEELSIDEIAVVLGRTPAAANSLLQRARGRVRRIVGAGERQ